MANTHTDEIRNMALQYQWMHNADWTQMAETGEPLVMVKGEGVRVTDSTGKTWLDVHGGYTCVHLGYGRTEIADVAYDQMSKITYFPQGTTTIPVIELCEKIAELTPGDLSRTFPGSGGSEANETAIKMAKAYHRRRGESGRYKIISRKGSYHGTTGGVMWLGNNATDFSLSDFEPAAPGMIHVPHPNHYRDEYNSKTPSETAIKCAQAIEDAILMHGPKTVAAVIGEPVSQPIGAPVPAPEYWPMVRDICDKYGVLLIIDEVITGFGRTGKMFGIEHFDIHPDIMTMGKGIISSYLPLAATTMSERIAETFGSDNMWHAVTSAGNPVAAAAALKNIEIIENENLVENSKVQGEYLKNGLTELMKKHPIVGDVRGIGLLLGMELVADRESKEKFSKEVNIAGKINKEFKNNGLILQSDGNVITVGPPLCVDQSDCDEIVDGIDASLEVVEQQLGVK